MGGRDALPGRPRSRNRAGEPGLQARSIDPRWRRRENGPRRHQAAECRRHEVQAHPCARRGRGRSCESGWAGAGSLLAQCDPRLSGMLRRFPEWAADADQAALLRRARSLDSTLNAFVQFREAVAAPCGPLNGVPYAAKDIFAAPDRQPFCGLGQPVPSTDCDYADALRLLDEAGGARIGYTHLTEIAYEPSGHNAVHGRVRNPWNFDFVSGGSSSGSAVAVACGAAVVALGSDTGGSLRIPAHACGVTAWKPSYGAVSMRGAMPLAPTLDTVGLLARGAAEMMQAARVLTDLRGDIEVRSGVVLSDALH